MLRNFLTSNNFTPHKAKLPTFSLEKQNKRSSMLHKDDNNWTLNVLFLKNLLFFSFVLKKKYTLLPFNS